MPEAAAMICLECLSDEVLFSEFKFSTGECSFCKNVCTNVPLSDVALRINKIVENYVCNAAEIPYLDQDSDRIYYEDGGETPSFIMQEIVGCEPNVAEALVEHLHRLTWYEVAKDGGEDFYDATSSRYKVFVQTNTLYYKETWDNFCHTIKHMRRFFNKEAETFLDALFERIITGTLATGTAKAMYTIEPSAKSGIFIFRARDASNPCTESKILAAPAQELASPPPTARTQGRMNPAGISAFYGCFEPTTCVAEIRIPVGGTALVGKFEIIRPLRLLDLRAFDKSSMKLSFFDHDFQEKHAYVNFMRMFHDEIRKPILPDQEMLEYLPMQFLAEYLALRMKLPVHGVVYSSALISEEGTNIVLFDGASNIEADLPKHKIREDDIPIPTLRLLRDQIVSHRVTAILYQLEKSPAILH